MPPVPLVCPRTVPAIGGTTGKAQGRAGASSEVLLIPSRHELSLSHLQCKMPSKQNSAEEGPSCCAASTSQAPQACGSTCALCLTLLTCLQQWVCSHVTCPKCCHVFGQLFPQLGHEAQHAQGYDVPSSRSGSRSTKRRVHWTPPQTPRRQQRRSADREQPRARDSVRGRSSRRDREVPTGQPGTAARDSPVRTRSRSKISQGQDPSRSGCSRRSRSRSPWGPEQWERRKSMDMEEGQALRRNRQPPSAARRRARCQQ